MIIFAIQNKSTKMKATHNIQVFKQLQTLFKKMPNKLQEGR